MPSFWSAVAKSRRTLRARAPSRAPSARRHRAAAWRTTRLAAATASGALAAIVGRDRAAPAACSVGGLTTPLTRPMRSASSASMIVAGEDQLSRRATPTRRRQPLRAAEAGDDAQADLGHARTSPSRRVDEVAGQRQLAAAAQREAVHRRDHRDAQRLDASHTRWPRSANAARLRPRHAGHLLDVRAGDEGLVAGAGEDHAAHAGVGRERARTPRLQRLERLRRPAR